MFLFGNFGQFCIKKYEQKCLRSLLQSVQNVTKAKRTKCYDEPSNLLFMVVPSN